MTGIAPATATAATIPGAAAAACPTVVSCKENLLFIAGDRHTLDSVTGRTAIATWLKSSDDGSHVLFFSSLYEFCMNGLQWTTPIDVFSLFDLYRVASPKNILYRASPAQDVDLQLYDSRAFLYDSTSSCTLSAETVSSNLAHTKWGTHPIPEKI